MSHSNTSILHARRHAKTYTLCLFLSLSTSVRVSLPIPFFLTLTYTHDKEALHATINSTCTHACTNTTLSMSPTLATHFTRIFSVTHPLAPFLRLLFSFWPLCAPPSLSLSWSLCLLILHLSLCRIIVSLCRLVCVLLSLSPRPRLPIIVRKDTCMQSTSL